MYANKKPVVAIVHAENWDHATLSKLEVLRQKCQDLEKRLENATKKTQDAEEQRIRVQVANEALEEKMAKQRSVPAIEKELEDERERAMRSEEEKRALEESIVQIRDQADAKVAASMQASGQANLQVSKTLDQLNNARMQHEAERLRWIAEKESLNSKLEDIHALREQIALAEKETKNLEEKLATERSKSTSLEQERNSLASSREAFEKDTKTRLEASWEGERENRHQVLEQAFEKRVRDLLLEKQNLVGELHDQTNLYKDRIANLEAENGKLKAQVQDQARQVREKETEKLSLQGRLDNSVSALREAQKDVRCLETAKRDMEQLGRDSAAQADLLAQKLAESSASVRALEAEREQLRVRNAQSQFLENSRDNDLGARSREMQEQDRASPGSRHHQHHRQQQQSADHHPQQTLERLQNQHERELQDAVTTTAHRTSERWRQKMQELRASHREEMHKAQHLLELERERHQSALREYELKLSFVRQQARTECASAAADVERVSMLNEKLLAQAPRRQLQGAQQHHQFQYAPEFADSEMDLRDEDFGPASSDWAPPHQGNHRSPGPVAQLNMHIAVLRDQCRSACGPRPSPLRCQEDLENLFRTEENMSRLYLRSDAMQRSPSPIPFPKIL
ncbi:Hypothetical Protein FCC1311_053902 [Hondaea fermentalgiana]|uniref:Uncharacterized protein n=1 Tax=Hondaea fermentalgiana TaxID=2315210 RepID=A0A2R5GHH0_9STRA|nr:Hypothetical Protein FCC1311_053902 [Hondaea fermentalgiana]|eukprot:GBG29168.1 Hypothetical Protein FCC1311_053902 [Hondaea fermentalgiana]